MKKLTTQQIQSKAALHSYTYENLNAVIKVESGGVGFSADGKLIIQFELSWFKRKAIKEYNEFLSLREIAIDQGNAHFTPSQHEAYKLWGPVLGNGVEGQSKEWNAFNAAFKINPNAAMESTSIGLMQVMGFHHKSLGFQTVGEMWDFAKESEENQLELAIRFIKLNPKLDKALRIGDAATFAYYYNGSAYKKFKYDTRLIAAGMKKPS